MGKTSADKIQIVAGGGKSKKRSEDVFNYFRVCDAIRFGRWLVYQETGGTRMSGARFQQPSLNAQTVLVLFAAGRINFTLEEFMKSLNPAYVSRARVRLWKWLLCFLFAAGAASAWAQTRVYELRTYQCYDGKLETLKANFRDFNIRILKRHGIESIGYWVPQDPALAKNTLIYIVVHPSRADADKNWAEFRKDPEFVKLAADAMKAGPIVEKIESVYLDPTDFSPLK
jgi:hypothetical protein